MGGCDVSYRSPGLKKRDGLSVYLSSSKEAAHENQVRHGTPIVNFVVYLQAQLLVEGT